MVQFIDVSRETPNTKSTARNLPDDALEIVSRETTSAIHPRDVSRETLPTTVVDVGSGAGFPGIVLACMLPDVQFYLVESMQRRVNWLQYVVDKIRLQNVTIIHSRAEDAITQKLVPPADYVTARAVAPLKKLLPWTMPFLRSGGKLLALKGERAAEEVEDAKNDLKKWTNQTTRILVGKTVEEAETTRVLEVVKK